ncbi:MAG: DHA2 family efflux MFS transporter permease subunit, partial [Rhodococcus sp. (in: high G+C Gram-positive bacteria)]|uniref:DHA2 family efflux MFS transporter permease subunit n=1 Tax=Rhodococcus sp. TaxID=1831 RepID=UPI003BAF7461
APAAKWTLLVVSVSTFMLMLDLTVVNVALPDIRAEFDASFSSLQWILDAYALGLAAILLAAGAVADRIGRRRVFVVGLVVFVVASLACGWAPGSEILIVARLVQGLGGAILFAVGPALIGHDYRGAARGKAFGVFGAVGGLAIAFGPLIGGVLTDAIGWRWIFLINVPLTLLAVVVAATKMRESRSATPPPLDIPGLLAFTVGLFFLVLGFMRGESDGWTSSTVIGIFAIAVVALIVCAVLQVARPGNAMFDRALFTNVTFNGLSVVTALCAASTMATLFLLISFVQNVLGYSAFAAGVRFLPLTLVLFAAAAVAGALVAKVQPGVLTGASQVFIAAGLFAVLWVDHDSTWVALVPSMVLIGLGMGLFNPPRAALSIAITTPEKAGAASGINETFQQVGLAVGIAAIGAFFGNRASRSFLEQPVTGLLGEDVHVAADVVAAGGVESVAASVPEEFRQAVREAGTAAFVDALHIVMVASGVLALVSAVVAFAFIRRRDLHETALANPGVPMDSAND